MALIPLFDIRNIVTYKLVDKEKIKIIMICGHAQSCQCKQKQTKILQNSRCWPQVQIRSASNALFLFLSINSQNICILLHNYYHLTLSYLTAHDLLVLIWRIVFLPVLRANYFHSCDILFIYLHLSIVPGLVG